MPKLSRDLSHWPIVNGDPRNLRASLREGRREWYCIAVENLATSGSRASIYLYDEIGFWGVSAGDFVAELLKLDVDNIDLHINSPGGEVFDGVAIYEALRQHRASVTTYVDSLAASAASFIAMAGDQVIMSEHAEMMIHDAMSLEIGNAADLRKKADLLDKVSDKIANIYAEKASTAEKWRAAMRTETWYDAKEAVAAGLANEVQTPRERPKDVPANKWDLSIFQYAGREAAPAPTPLDAPQPTAPVDGFSMFSPEQFRSAIRKAV